jgi:hypothetical protein
MQNEIQMFFRLSSDVAAAKRTGDAEALADALFELVGFWVHARNAKVQARYEGLLEAHGMRAEMDAISDQWAAR